MSLSYVEHARAVRARLMNPPNAVVDTGINLRTSPPAAKAKAQVFEAPSLKAATTIAAKRRRERKYKARLAERQKNFKKERIVAVPGISPLVTLSAIVCNDLLVERAELMSRLRNAHVYYAREIFCLIAKTRMGRSYPAIGRFLGRDHTSVLSAVRNGERRIKADASYAVAVEKIWHQLEATGAEWISGIVT